MGAKVVKGYGIVLPDKNNINLLIELLITKFSNGWRNTCINTDQVIDTILSVIFMWFESFYSVDKEGILRGLSGNRRQTLISD